jgi:hypothetical protein
MLADVLVYTFIFFKYSFYSFFFNIILAGVDEDGQKSKILAHRLLTGSCFSGKM